MERCVSGGWFWVLFWNGVGCLEAYRSCVRFQASPGLFLVSLSLCWLDVDKFSTKGPGKRGQARSGKTLPCGACLKTSRQGFLDVDCVGHSVSVLSHCCKVTASSDIVTCRDFDKASKDGPCRFGRRLENATCDHACELKRSCNNNGHAQDSIRSYVLAARLQAMLGLKLYVCVLWPADGL